MSDTTEGMDQPPGDEEGTPSASPWASPTSENVATPSDAGPAPSASIPGSSSELSTPTKSKGPKIALVIAALVLLVGGGIGAALLLGSEDAPTAEGLLVAAKKFLKEPNTATVTGEGTVKSGDLKDSGGNGAPGSGFTQRSKIKGQVALPDRLLVREDSGSAGVTEVLVIKKDTYVRYAEKLADLDEAKWAKEELPPGVVEPEEDGPILDMNDSASGGPLDLDDLIAVAKPPKDFTKEGKLYVLKLELDPKALLSDSDQTGAELGETSLTLRLEKSGKVASYSMRITGEVADLGPESRFETNFTWRFVWGEKVNIKAPEADELDATPEMNEEALSKFTAAPVLVPAAIPSGWTLTLADVIPPDQTAEECEEVTIDYENVDDPENGYLYLFVFNADCEGLDMVPPPGADSFRPGRAREGYVVGTPEDGWFAQFLVDNTVIQVADTDLNPEELSRVMENLTIFDPKQKPGEIEGIGVPTDVG